MSLKVNPVPIITDHLKTLRNERTQRTSLVEIGVQYIAPLATGVVAAKLGFQPTSFGNWIAGLAILFGFFFALAVFVFQLRVQMTADPANPSSPLKRQINLRVPVLVDELFVNACYAVLACALATVVAVVVDSVNMGWVGTAVVVFLSSHVVLLVLMCLKRVHTAYKWLKVPVSSHVPIQ